MFNLFATYLIMHLSMSSTNGGSAGIPRGNWHFRELFVNIPLSRAVWNCQCWTPLGHEEIERPTLIYYKLDTNFIDNSWYLWEIKSCFCKESEQIDHIYKYTWYQIGMDRQNTNVNILNIVLNARLNAHCHFVFLQVLKIKKMSKVPTLGRVRCVNELNAPPHGH
jgi:hypothetical protein